MPYISGGMHAGSATKRKKARYRRAAQAADLRRREKIYAQQQADAQKQAQLQLEAKKLQVEQEARERHAQIEYDEKMRIKELENQLSQDKFLSTIKSKVDRLQFQLTVKSVERYIVPKNKELMYAQVLLNIGINNGDYTLIDEALEKNADINDCYYFSNPPLDSAIQKSDLKLIAYLWTRKADLHLTGQYSHYPFFAAIRTNNPELFNWFAEKEADAIRVRDKHGLTALHHAAAMNNEIALKYLLSHGANVDAVDNYGGTAIHAACRAADFKCLDILMEQGAKLTMSREYQAPAHLERMFMFALKNAKYEMITDLFSTLAISKS